MNKKIIGIKVRIEDLEVNDLFYMEFANKIIKFRVNFILEDDLLAHGLNWLKEDCILIKKKNRDLFYAGKMSKFRAFFL